MVHVAYRLWGGDGFFAKMTGVSMLSMFENTKSKVTVHIMHNNRLTAENRDKFNYIAGQYNQCVDFRNVEVLASDTIKKLEEVFPLKSEVNASYYPFLLQDVFPDLDKVIFLGADTVINLDINELWKTNVDDYTLAAVPECLNFAPKNWIAFCMAGFVKYEDYFNCDVMVIKPSFFREKFNDIIEGCKFARKNAMFNTLAEQDVLNYCFAEKALKLPGEFNRYIRTEHQFHQPCRIRKILYHYSGDSGTMKISLDMKDIFNRLYFSYFLKTPWAEPKMFENILNSVNNIYRNQKNDLLYLTNLVSRRKRAFFTGKNNFDALKKIFDISEEEQLIDETEPNAMENLTNSMKDNKDKQVVFLLTGNYPILRNNLIIQNFVEGKDFINALMVVPEQYGGVKLDSRLISEAI